MTILRLLSFIFCIAATSAAMAQQEPERITQAKLIAEVESITPGKPFWAAVEIRIADGWHMYWLNPGDSGIPTTLTWSLPDGVKAGPIEWQAPHRLPYDTMVNYGYDTKTHLLARISPSETLGTSGEITLKTKLDLLVCREICIPESAALELSLPLADEAKPSSDSQTIASLVSALPTPFAGTATFEAGKDKVVVTLTPPQEPITLFPVTDGVIRNDVAGIQEASEEATRITFARGHLPNVPASFEAWLVNDATRAAQTVMIQQSGVTAATAEKPVSQDMPMQDASAMGLWQALLFALLGGVLLNVMPCVLPVLSLKALAIAKKSAADSVHVRRQGLAYSAGTTISFTAISAVLIALQQAGEQVGWGFQLQSPVFVTVMTWLMFLVGLNLSGLFQLPTFLGGVGQSITQKDTALGSFATGILAVVVASPCVVPLMAPAIGFALTQPPAQALTIFAALGFGLGLPYLLICFVPALYRRMPKPGAWMIVFKELLAFAMYATAIWLAWVLMQQTGAQGVVTVLSGALVIVIGLWWRRQTHSPLWRAVALIAALAACAALIQLQRSSDPMPHGSQATHSAFSREHLQSLRDSGSPVFVNATAAWCITCKVNERVALHTQEVQAAFKEAGVVVMVADWTNRDAEIGSYLKQYGRNGVPLYVYYAPGEDPVILPQLLTPSIVLDYISPKQ